MNRIENIITRNKLDKSVTQQAILYKGEAYFFFDEGLTRYVFANESKTKVIKILIDDSRHAHDFNKEELDIYNRASEENKARMATTTMDETTGRLIEQEFCNPVKFDKRAMTIPQMRFAGSCRNEVGWNKEGVLVCFDLDEFKKY